MRSPCKTITIVAASAVDIVPVESHNPVVAPLADNNAVVLPLRRLPLAVPVGSLPDRAGMLAQIERRRAGRVVEAARMPALTFLG